MGSRGVAPFDQPYFRVLLVFPAFGPGLAALLVAWTRYGPTEVGALLKPLIQWRVRPQWYLVAVAGPVLLLLAGRSISAWLGLSATQSEGRGDLFSLALAAFVLSLFSNPWEEVGWRGFALRHLQARYSALVATLIIGVLWGLWHLPLFFWRDNPMADYPFLPWLVSIVAGSFVYTWLYNSTGGSLLIVTLFHVSMNTVWTAVDGVPVILLAALHVLVALALVLGFGGAHLSRLERVRAG